MKRELTRRGLFGLLAGAAAAATQAPKLLQAAKSLRPPKLVDPDALPDPLDARNWGAPELRPCGFVFHGIDRRGTLPAPFAIYALAADEPPRPGTVARLVNIAPPALSPGELAAGRHRLWGDPVVVDPGEWRRGLYTFSPPAVYDDPGYQGVDRGWWKAPPAIYGAEGPAPLTATAAYQRAVDNVLAFERARRAQAMYIDRSLRESFWRG